MKQVREKLFVGGLLAPCDGRQLHEPLAERRRSSDSGGAGPRVREDGAWRCDIKHGIANALRLMRWKLSDGTIELGRAAVHGNMQLR
ncbi:hypothetical protein [Streptomyces sp. NBC_01727]|uniref:hypothetical protein n=1 Tax=Streptomyces sp. NBC_01727 TaxID=2975924 RepID=UPI002E0F2432|nr:hypothetical protein OIE76_43090 [Streptomyces sp. NBC_01727]